MKYIILFLSSIFVSSANAGKEISLVHYGWLSYAENNKVISLKEYRLAYGITDDQDAKANSPARVKLGPFAFNAAMYTRNADNTWNLFNFRLPGSYDSGGSLTKEDLDFLEYLKRPDVIALLESPYIKSDFGAKSEFIYKKMGFKSSQLASPFNQFPYEVLTKLDMILIYNADGTGKAYFTKPYDLEQYALDIFSKINSKF